MSCPALEQLAACAAEGDSEVEAHAAGCSSCAERLDAQRDAAAIARRLVTPSLAAPRRAELAAEVLARAEAEPAPHRGARIAVASSLAAAAVIALVLFANRHAPAPRVARAGAVHTVYYALPRTPGMTVAADLAPPAAPRAIAAPVHAASAPPAPAAHRASPAPAIRAGTPPHDGAGTIAATRATGASHDTAAATVTSGDAGAGATAAPAEVVATGGDMTRASYGGLDTIALRDGVLAVDARDRAPVSITTRDTTVEIAQARAVVVAQGGVIVSTRVFAGSVEISRGGMRQVIVAGDVWTPPPGPETSLAAFRAGWEALHAGRTADAIAAFDRATDPVVAEDAAFWAAIATARDGDHADAIARLRSFLSRFPHSPRAADARAALARLRRGGRASGGRGSGLGPRASAGQ